MSENQYFKQGRRLAEVRKELGLSSEDMAQKVGILGASYRQIETGAVGFSMRLIIVLDSVYKVSINWLLSGTGPKFIQESASQESTLIVGFSDIMREIEGIKERLKALES